MSKMRTALALTLALLAGTAMLQPTAQAQATMADVEVKAQQLSDKVYMVTGAGGNIGLFVGDDGVVMVDAQYAAISDKILVALRDITQQPLKLLVNTHHHRDHVDGNANFVAAGAVVVAHEKVVPRVMNDENFDPAGAPTITFSDKLSLRVASDVLQLQHYPTAHTDNDAVVWFADENVIHAGDLFFKDRFPFIDLNSGGTVQGYIDAIEHTMAMLADDTQIIPGHGSLANKADWQRLVSMIVMTREEVRLMMLDGLSVEQMVERGLAEQWQDWSWGFINEERWIRTLYNDMTR